MGQNDLHRIRVSTGTHRGQVKNRELSWARFAHQFETPSVDQSLKHADYRAMSVDERTAIKARSGYVVGAQFKDGVRRLANMEKRWVLSFDLDTVTPAQMAQIDMGVSAICGIEFLRHTTRSHIPSEPRWRFHVPLRRGVDHEEANAITRILATQLLVDPAESIDVVDVVSHRFAQVSYLPSRSADQEYLYERNEAELLDPGKVLAAFDGNWRDHTQLPMRSDERTARGVDPARKMEDPREKAGVIGAFCRTFDIEAAIARFLPEVYIPGDDMGSLPRYSYALGTSVNGAVVYDDGLFITSHHGSDPIEGSANAWDMVRIHMFGGKDKAAREGTTPGKMPSFKAMSALAITLPEVRTALLSGRQAQFDDDDEPDFDLDDDDDEPPAAPADPDDLGDFGLGDDVVPWADEFAPVKRKKRKKTAEWESMLQLHPESGAILHTQSNIALILTHGPGLAGTISFCLFTRGLVTRKPVGLPGLPLVREPIPDNWAGREWRDIDEVDRRLLLSSLKDRGGYEMETTVGDIAAAVAYAAKADAFNPIIEQIEAQRWDGVERVASLWIDFLGTPDDCYHRETAQAWCMAAVTRLYEPGHKFDFAPVISGPQGVGKSTFIAALSFGYFRELSDQLDNQSRLIESMHGGWLIEMGELQGLARADVEVVKKFMTAVEDTIRLAYRRNAETFKRQSVFCGTTNKDEYLKDDTGNRRFWPIQAGSGQIDVKRAAALAPQIWAEARVLYLRARKAQPFGTLPLGVLSEAAMLIGTEKQEDARLPSLAEMMADRLITWLETPVSPSAAVDSDGFDDDDAASQDLARRMVASNRDLWTRALGHPKDPSSADLTILGAAMRKVPGWKIERMRDPSGADPLGGNLKTRFLVRDGWLRGNPLFDPV